MARSGAFQNLGRECLQRQQRVTSEIFGFRQFSFKGDFYVDSYVSDYRELPDGHE